MKFNLTKSQIVSSFYREIIAEITPRPKMSLNKFFFSIRYKDTGKVKLGDIQSPIKISISGF